MRELQFWIEDCESHLACLIIIKEKKIPAMHDARFPILTMFQPQMFFM